MSVYRLKNWQSQKEQIKGKTKASSKLNKVFISGFNGTLQRNFRHGVPLITVYINITLSVRNWAFWGQKKINRGGLRVGSFKGTY